jgi:hypothetical protein
MNASDRKTRAITVRNLPRELDSLIRRRARKSRTSVNRVVVQLLEEAAGSREPKKREPYTDLDGLIGIWSEAEARKFDAALAEQRRIDPELWR